MADSRKGGAELGRSHPANDPRGTVFAGRYWPVGYTAPRLPDDTIDIRALCRLYDRLANQVPHAR